MPSDYAFADRAHEQRRLASQAELFDPLTERVFRAAGLGTGMRVLDLGSGAGDVAMLAEQPARPAEVVGRDALVHPRGSGCAGGIPAGFSGLTIV